MAVEEDVDEARECKWTGIRSGHSSANSYIYMGRVYVIPLVRLRGSYVQ